MHFSSLQGKLSLPFACLPTGTACWGLRETSAQQKFEFLFMFLLARLLLALEDFSPGHKEKQARRK